MLNFKKALRGRPAGWYSEMQISCLKIKISKTDSHN